MSGLSRSRRKRAGIDRSLPIPLLGKPGDGIRQRLADRAMRETELALGFGAIETITEAG